MASGDVERPYRLGSPLPYPGCYSIDLYCDHAASHHAFDEFPHSYSGGNERAALSEARADGWKIHQATRTATCPKCVRALARLRQGDNDAE